MIRLLLLLAIVFVAALIVMKLYRAATARRSADIADGPRDDPTAAEQAPEAKLVRCVKCGAYVPRGSALSGPDGFLCSDPRCRDAA